ncbi:hypothetical protein BDP27DRAFT_600573 [Rhodocollybia butyracea]|uniref:Uncharacterized protein n=1 Tax=Rhodocollybia butyracea TaxID=206335 RepID=A0A9P5UG87_9AGAR|nr:hypothetical protein BDP27DRAFT_600573 [Rhodocollybia butyracea]
MPSLQNAAHQGQSHSPHQPADRLKATSLSHDSHEALSANNNHTFISTSAQILHHQTPTTRLPNRTLHHFRLTVPEFPLSSSAPSYPPCYCMPPSFAIPLAEKWSHFRFHLPQSIWAYFRRYDTEFSTVRSRDQSCIGSFGVYSSPRPRALAVPLLPLGIGKSIEYIYDTSIFSGSYTTIPVSAMDQDHKYFTTISSSSLVGNSSADVEDSFNGEERRCESTMLRLGRRCGATSMGRKVPN